MLIVYVANLFSLGRKHQKLRMKFAIALLPVLALMCYAAPDVYVPWTYPGPGQATFQERNPYPLYQPVQEQDVQGYESDREYGPVQEQSAPVDAYAYGMQCNAHNNVHPERPS